MISERTIREVTALGVYDNHAIHTTPVGHRHECHCSCGWLSTDAYGDRYDAGSAGARHQEAELKRELELVGIKAEPTD